MEQHSFPAEIDGKRVEIIDKRYVNGVIVLTDTDGNQYTTDGSVNAELVDLDKDKLPEGGYTQDAPNITTADSEAGLAVTKDGSTEEVHIPTQEALAADGSDEVAPPVNEEAKKPSRKKS